MKQCLLNEPSGLMNRPTATEVANPQLIASPFSGGVCQTFNTPGQQLRSKDTLACKKL